MRKSCRTQFKYLAALLFLFSINAAWAKSGGQGESSGVIYCSEFHVTRPLRELVAEHPVDESKIYEKKESEDREHRVPQKFRFSVKDGPQYGNDPSVMQTTMGTVQGNRAPLTNWAGQIASGFRPFDPSGAAGKTVYVQMINSTTFKVYNKSTGAVTLTATLGNLWSPATANAGDPIVLYDMAADRWLLAQFGSSTDKKIYIAISTTGDPTGSYYTYTFVSPQFPDYLKFSVWADGYYMTSNQSTQKVFAFERSAMLAGNSGSRAVYTTFSPPNGTGFFVPLPGDASDGVLPASGTPCPIFSYSDNGWGAGYSDAVNIYQMAVNWVPTTPTATISLAANVATAAFDATYNSSWNDVSQPNTTQKLDGIGGVCMFRSQWKSWSGYNTVVLNWAVQISSTQRSIKWCELRQNQSSGVWSIYQEGIYTPDAATRWMGSIAMDNNGSIGMAYMKSDATSIYPGLYYTGRRACDPLGTLPITETQVVSGAGSQTGINRDGDYAQMVLDPDGVTFWYTGEYMGGATGGSAARTQIFSYQIPSCSNAAAVSISITGGSNPQCAGASATFTAVPTNGGSAPAYQWQVNGINVGTNSATYTTTALTNGQVVTCIMTSNLAGVSGSPATSNSITMTVNAYVTSSVNITASPGNSICSGSNVTFTATPVNGGTTPSYQWKNGTTNVGTNSATYSSATLANGNSITCVMTSNASCVNGSPATSNAITMTVTPTVTASVSITSDVGNTICAGTNVTFTATPTNGGSSPSYQWKVGATNAGTNSPTFSSTTLANGNSVTCVMTSNATCPSGSPATSNAITMTVNPIVTAGVSIAASPGNSVCSGTNVTFTATPTNGGTAPVYQWMNGATNVGTNSATYSSASLLNGDAISCVMTSNASCISGSPATSNAITMTVNAYVTSSVSITASPGNSICSGTNVTFTAIPVNGGTTPSYQWKNGTTNVGTNSATYSSATLANGNSITCVMTSNASCVNGSPATSNAITMTVTPTVTASVSITTDVGNTICTGTNVTFTATPTNGGSSPSYQWKVGATNAGTNSPTFSSTTLANGNSVTCVMTSNAVCPSGSPATSNAITMTVNPNVTAGVSITASPGNSVCSGVNVTFTATPTNGGTAPVYQWKNGTTNVGTNTTTYSTASLLNGDAISCVMTSNAPCVIGSPATSSAISMTVTPSVTPAVTIAQSTGTNPACAGSSLTFTATPANGGATPSYQWKVNGTNAGTNSTTFTSSALTDGQAVTCVMTSNATCATPAAVTSNGITVGIIPLGSVSVSVTQTGGTNPLCVGASATFTAAFSYGSNPVYQWKVDGVNAGTNSQTFTSTSLTNGQVVSCSVTATPACPVVVTKTLGTGTSTNTTNVPAAYPTAYGNGRQQYLILASELTALGMSAGNINSLGFNVAGTAGNPSTLNGYTIKLATTATTTMGTAFLTPVFATVFGPVNYTPTLSSINTHSFAAPFYWDGTSNLVVDICFSNQVTGVTAYQTYRTSALSFNSTVYYQANGATGAGACTQLSGTTTTRRPNMIFTTGPTTASASSNALTMTVTSSVTPSVSIALTTGTNPLCAGSTATFTATPVNGGVTPAYQWKNGAAAVGSNSATYSTASLNNGDVISCLMTSSASCASQSQATSNSITMGVSTALGASVSGNSLCAGAAVNVSYTACGAFVSGNVFTAQLSDASGSFAAPVNIGTVTSTTAGTISCTVPVNTAPGTGYRIRTVSSNPVLTGTDNGSNLTISHPVAAAGNNGPVCAGIPVNFTSSGGTGFSWTGPNGFSSSLQNPVLSNPTSASTGTYTVTVTDASGCTATATTIATINPLPAAVASSNSPRCAGGSLNLTATGGSSYSWSGPNGFVSAQQNPVIANVTSVNGGTYTVTVTDALGCSASSTTNVVVTTISPAASGNSPLCAGSTLNLVSGGGSSYSWTGPNAFTSAQQSPSISNVTSLNSGTFTVTVTGANGCTATAAAMVQVISVSPTASANSPLCAGSTLNLSAGGGASYSWTGPNGFTSAQQNPSITNVTSLNGGAYTVTVTGANSCSATAATSVIITTISPSASCNSPLCGGNTLNLAASGGTSYSWTGPNGFISSLQNPAIANVSGVNGGTYTVTVSGTNGCSATATTSVVVNTISPAASGNSPLCPGGTLNLTASGGASYTWTGPDGFSSTQQNPVISNVTSLSSGTYTVTVTGSSGCSATAVTSVVVNTVSASASSNSPRCAGSTLNLAANGGTSYSWTGPNGFSSTQQNPLIPNVTSLNVGTYVVTVTGSGGCTATASSKVLVNTINASASGNSPLCAGGTLNLFGSGGTGYSWTGPAGFSSASANPVITIVNGSNGGTYTVTVSGISGCSATSTTNIVVNTVTATASGNSPVCAGSALNLSSGGGVGYSWTGPNGFLSGVQNPVIANTAALNGGTYTVTVTGATGCTSVAQVTIAVTTITATAAATPSLCAGGTINLSADGGNAYAWTGPNGFISFSQYPFVGNAVVAATGTYMVSVTGADNCTATAAVPVTVHAIPFVTAGSDSPVCEGSSLNLTAAGGQGYSWTGPGNFSSSLQNPVVAVFTSANAGTYEVTVSNSDGCTASAAVTVTMNANCAGLSLNLNLHLYLEGYFNPGTGLMRPTLWNLWDQFSIGNPTTDITATDTIEVDLFTPANALALGTIPDYSNHEILHSNGTAQVVFQSAVQGQYYLVVRHRTSIETWSREPVDFSTGSATYDFTAALNSAYDDGRAFNAPFTNPPMHMLSNGSFGIYSGDCNRDGTMDILDMGEAFNDGLIGFFGYSDDCMNYTGPSACDGLASDCNGDGAGDILDMGIIFNNSNDLPGFFYSRPGQ